MSFIIDYYNSYFNKYVITYDGVCLQILLQDIEEILIQTSAHGLTYFAEMKYGRMEHKEHFCHIG